MPMTLSLCDKSGNQIFSWKPEQENWWITGFNPEYQNVEATCLVAHGTMDMSQDDQVDMWKSFFDKYKTDPIWKFYKDHHTAEFTWVDL